MDTKKDGSLKEKIIEEMTVDYSNALEKNFNLAKQFIRITKDGKVEVLHKDRLNGKEQIMLYLIGKLYAKEAEFASTDDAGNNELLNELGIPSGSLLPWLKELREENKIRQIKKGKYVHHSISVNLVEKILNHIEKKLKKHA
ncbi:MAG: hypothetical protein HZB79_03250 [Deltaproteobacteria bacterium]|nr:hypothetical protein [Deltaproteobacteria bacterium]